MTTRILVVDDDALILTALSRILQSEGYEVVTHNDPLSAAREEGIHVVLTDFMMPGMNGIETLRALKTAKPDLQVVMLSGREQAATIRQRE